MNRWFWCVAAVVCLESIAPGLMALSPEPIQHFGVLGDSFSDNGKRFWGPSPPYYQHRYCDGPVWSELAWGQLGLPPERVGNYALSGDTTWGYLSQVNLYLSHVGFVPEGTLLCIFIGTNDYLDPTDWGNPDPETTTAPVVGRIEQGIRTLQGRGADRFLVFKLPELWRYPYRSAEPYRSRMQPIVLHHNQRIDEMAPRLEAELGIEVQVFDTEALCHTVLDNPFDYGFTDVTSECLGWNYAPCVSPRTTFFFDDIHPNSLWNEILASEVVHQLRPVDHTINAVLDRDPRIVTDRNADGALDAADVVHHATAE